jgi:hypothetical protein
VALVVECGQHFLRSSSNLAEQVTRNFLTHFGLLERSEDAPALAPQRRFELQQVWVVKTPEFRFTRPLIGFETFDVGELIATDGSDEIRAPCADCTVLTPARQPIVGREGV